MPSQPKHGTSCHNDSLCHGRQLIRERKVKKIRFGTTFAGVPYMSLPSNPAAGFHAIVCADDRRRSPRLERSGEGVTNSGTDNDKKTAL